MDIRAFWDIAMIIALMIEAVRTSEMSVYSNETTQRYIPQGSSNVHTRRRENVKFNS
jgi:hypothetical protein